MDNSLYFSFLILFHIKFWFNCPLCCDAVPCQDYFSEEPKPCFPQPINAARQRNISATNTCGTPKSSYCEIGPGKTCFVCDANSSLTMHPAGFMVDQENPLADSPTWWQSDTWWATNQMGISKMGHPLHVNVTLNLGKSYHLSGKIKVQFYSERPQALVIERSKDNGQSWMPYQYFAKDCLTTYGMIPSESVPANDPLKVTCSEQYSGQFPTKNGIVEFQAYTRYSPENYLQPEIQDFLKATHVKLRLEYPGTDGLELIDSEVTLNRYYYAISNIRVDGRCDCHGHAEFCDGVGMNQYCFCEHNTRGRDCEYCKPLYNNKPWKAANKTHANECQKCNCNEHATACTYDYNLETGACIGCIHKTTGTHCDQCSDGSYRNVSKVLSDPNVCLACDCFPVGIIDNGMCNKDATVEIPLGQCNCKPNVFGRRCDECVPGYWGFRLPPGGRCQDCTCNVLGSLNRSIDCDQQTGACFCKPFVQGEKCSECSDGYYSFPTALDQDCLTCSCDLGGASKKCEKESGRCVCRNNIEGKRCVTPKSGYFHPNFDYLLFETERQDEKVENHLEKQTASALFTGQGFTPLTFGSAIHFKNIQVDVTWKYYIVLRYSAERLPSERNLTLSISGSETMNEISISFSELHVGSGLAWAASEAINLDIYETYNVSVGLEGVHVDDMDEAVLLLDSLVLKPEITSTRVYKESTAEIVTTLLECFHNSSALTTNNVLGLQCPRFAFSHSAEMYDGAVACRCHQLGTNIGVPCDPSGGQCSCYEGVGGRTCSYCLVGYYGFGYGSCKVCQCSSAGVKSEICNLISGICNCKSFVSGARCNVCKHGTFNLNPQNPQGCQTCFGYGHGVECTSAHGFIASQISSNFLDPALDGWRVLDNSTAVINIGGYGLEIDGNLTVVAPRKYLGVHLRSYKKSIDIKVVYKSAVNTSRDAMHILLKGRGYQALLKPNSKTLQNITKFSFTVSHGPSMTDFQFQSMLSNLTSVELIVRNSNLVIREVILESAVYDPMNDASAYVGFVENMTCLSNYTGLSCETCAPGFTRVIPNNGPFSECVPCSCNNRASECDPESGVCVNCDIGSAGEHCEECQFNVIGPHCNVCADGFYGLTEDDRDCKPCDCHLPGTQHRNTSGCNETTGQCECNQTLHTGGRRCSVCQENAWNRTDSSLNCEECPSCYGMVMMKVDKFRQNLSSLFVVLRSLRGLSVLSVSESFSEHLRQTTNDVEELKKTSKVFKSKEDDVHLIETKAFETIGIFYENSKIQSSAVNETVDVTERRLIEFNENKRVFESAQYLVTVSYHLLTETMEKQTDQLLKSLQLLRDWSKELHKTKIQSKTKVGDIRRTKESVIGDLETAVKLTTQTTTDAMSVIASFRLLLARFPKLQLNSSSVKVFGENTLKIARQRYHNASLVFNTTSQLDIMDQFNTANTSEMLWLNQHSEEDKKTASHWINTVQDLVKSNLDIATETLQALKLVPIMQEKVRQFESMVGAYYSESRRYADEAVSLVTEAEGQHQEAENTLTTVRDFSNNIHAAKEHSDLSQNNIAELSSFHRTKILFAKNVSEYVESSSNLSETMVRFSRTLEQHTIEEHKVVSNLLIVSEKIRNDSTTQQGVITKVSVTDHINTMVGPVREKCSYLIQEALKTMSNSSTTIHATVQLLDKFNYLSGKLDETIKDASAMPGTNSKSLPGMKFDIARIRVAFKALKLTASLVKLHQEKIIQEIWLAAYKPRVMKLRSDIIHLQELLASLKSARCYVNE